MFVHYIVFSRKNVCAHAQSNEYMGSYFGCRKMQEKVGMVKIATQQQLFW